MLICRSVLVVHGSFGPLNCWAMAAGIVSRYKTGLRLDTHRIPYTSVGCVCPVCAPRIARAAGQCCHVQRHLLGTRTARDARLFGPARRRPARFLGKRRAARRHKIGRAGGCRRASAGHGNYAGHSRLKRPPMASLAATTSCAKFGRNDTIPLRGSWCNSHTPLLSKGTYRLDLSPPLRPGGRLKSFAYIRILFLGRHKNQLFRSATIICIRSNFAFGAL